jgi:hypothetical protein
VTAGTVTAGVVTAGVVTGGNETSTPTSGVVRVLSVVVGAAVVAAV